MERYERTCAIERSEKSDPGSISGILATDGEASDGHILNIRGIEIPEHAPLLFGHDDFTGERNLGSWTSFKKKYGEGLGGSVLRGHAQIELDGVGSKLEWRQDMAHMVDRQHIRSFSVRWEEIGTPIRRVNLPSDHVAYLDPRKATGRQYSGLYFDKSRLVEGSIVTLGSDHAALVGRMQETEGDVRQFWRAAINYALTEREEIAGLVAVALANGEQSYVERAVYDAMLEEANARLQTALDIHEAAEEVWALISDTNAAAKEIAALDRSEGERSHERDDPEETQPEPKKAATLPATEIVRRATESLFEGLESRLDQRMEDRFRRHLGRVS